MATDLIHHDSASLPLLPLRASGCPLGTHPSQFCVGTQVIAALSGGLGTLGWPAGHAAAWAPEFTLPLPLPFPLLPFPRAAG